MSDRKIEQAIERLFAEGASIVFWNDADQEFHPIVESLALPGVELLRLDQTATLKAKLMMEREAPHQKWLVYASTPEPDPVDDWLLDIRLRSKPFRADSVSILLDELGLTTHSLRNHIKARSKFLKSKERVERLKRWTLPEDDGDDLDRKMIAVLVRADQPEPFTILLRLFADLVVDGEADLNATPKAWQEILSNDLEPSFWVLVERQTGYKESEPSLRDLLIRILVTDFARNLNGHLPGALKHFKLPDTAKAANASVFAGRWRSDISHFASYNALSAAVAKELGLSHLLAHLSAEILSDILTFEDIERRIIQDLRDRIIAGAGANMDPVRSIISRRRDGHWANRVIAQGNPSTQALAACYDALEAAAGFFELQASHAAGFSFPHAPAAYAAYQDQLFQFDQLYRRFMRASELIEPMGWSLLHTLRDRIEASYSGWFMPHLASAWDKVLEGECGLLANWSLPGKVNQQDFYAKEVMRASNNGTKRIFVIISDAFRYEAAEELVRELNAKNRVKASLNAMLGVLPSYTTLGMASLLPHKELVYRNNLGVWVDGLPSATIEQRSAILAKVGGIAVKADNLLEKGKTAGREFVGSHKLIYVYHDRIDMIGDKQSSETKTFEAVSDTIDELAKLIGFIVNSLNGSTVLVTADHGFLYQEAAMEEADKSVLGGEPAGALRSKKRYILGQQLGCNPKVWYGTTAGTAGTKSGEGSMDFWLPKGAARFHFVGGARFVHGSAMPQEIVVPVITVNESDSKAKSRFVEFNLLGSSNKVVTNKQRFEFIQTEAVTEQILPRTVLISLRDGDQPISDEQSLTFESHSQLLDERKRSVILTVQSGTYDRTKDFWLVARDAQSKVEVLRIPFKVDLAIINDF